MGTLTILRSLACLFLKPKGVREQEVRETLPKPFKAQWLLYVLPV